MKSKSVMQQKLDEIKVPTRGRGLYEITTQVQNLLEHSGLKTGLVTLLIRHTSASLLIQENADPEVRRDLERFFSRLTPDGDALYHHNAEGDDDMPAHVRTALTTVNLGIPFEAGQLGLGTWQGIYVWEHRTVPHIRSVLVHLLGE